VLRQADISQAAGQRAQCLIATRFLVESQQQRQQQRNRQPHSPAAQRLYTVNILQALQRSYRHLFSKMFSFPILSASIAAMRQLRKRYALNHESESHSQHPASKRLLSPITTCLFDLAKRIKQTKNEKLNGARSYLFLMITFSSMMLFLPI
jgi:hypothetical protein